MAGLLNVNDDPTTQELIPLQTVLLVLPANNKAYCVAEAICLGGGKRLIPGGSRKPSRKVTALLAAGYKATNLEAIRLTGTSRL